MASRVNYDEIAGILFREIDCNGKEFGYGGCETGILAYVNLEKGVKKNIFY